VAGEALSDRRRGAEILDHNPEERRSAASGAIPSSEERLVAQPEAKDTQFADYHGHGWIPCVFKRDRKGTQDRTEAGGRRRSDKFRKAVHLSSIHLDLGMHCVDCHFAQGARQQPPLQRVAAAIEIDCADCHGTATATQLYRPAPRPPGGTELALLRAGRPQALRVARRQALALGAGPDRDGRDAPSHTVERTTRNTTPAARAKPSRPAIPAMGPRRRAAKYAHGNDRMSCQSCHTSWTTPAPVAICRSRRTGRPSATTTKAGARNYATYNPQVARDEMFQLGKHGPVKGGKIAPVRSSSALILSSTNINREKIYIQQPPIAASGFSSQAFAPHYPHTERKTETKTCTDCHVSEQNDNNAIMAQLLLHGTNFVNFVGFNAWVGEEKRVSAVTVTEWDEPQAVIGSYLHRYAYPDWYARHQQNQQKLQEGFAHGAGMASCLQLRGEYLYVAEGSRGMRVYDVPASQWGISQRSSRRRSRRTAERANRLGRCDASRRAQPADRAHA
jgi:hypothetical protein